MDTEKIQEILAALSRQNFAIRGADGHAAVSEIAGVCDGQLNELGSLLGEGGADPQRFGPLVYSLRSIYRQAADTRAMVDVPRLVDWSDAVIARIGRELSDPAPATAAAVEGEAPAGEAQAAADPSAAG